MAVYPCIACGAGVVVDTRHLGPWAAQALLSPVEAIGSDCIARLSLTITVSAGLRRLTYQGRIYLEICDTFVHSGSPRVAHIYEGGG